ncbi:hypothetical protein [Paracoccus chinensis]|uniref:Uncharacterized protein n=1 Tax=Paracoccus chinensis TaxID=525640 RepID=A0A1G9NVX2_9RHOB|nr:hypothetical protein [Paracoccus chinensis]SDL90736.1 hypothetical protein SAMN04487971_1378 [Paracoccus chinensis]
MGNVEIRDGSPWWYLSPDIWVVPGSDPQGAPGVPVAGKPAFVWARLTNHAGFGIQNVQVDFFWAVPTPQITRASANPIGTAFADLAPAGQPGSEVEVLCLTPWPVVMVNGGHECLIAEARYPGSSVPASLAVFDPPTYSEMAQKNLTVLAASMMMMPLTITIDGLPRQEKLSRLVVEVGGEVDERALRSLGLPELRPLDGAVEAGLRDWPACLQEDEPTGDKKMELKVPRGGRAAVYLNIRAWEMRPEGYVLVNVLEFDGAGDRREPIGGCAFLVVHEEIARQKEAIR